MKRLFDVLASAVALTVLAPVMLPLVALVWLQDFHNPFYIAIRARGKGRPFKMIKLRSMIVNADRKGGASTASNDHRVTRIGSFIRKFKFDEVPQLINVFKGDMSLVGPRPQVTRDVDSLYTDVECELFRVRPGITDFSSIVFSDEGDILKGAVNADLHYNQYIRPWKSRLGLFYAEHTTFTVDLKLIVYTVIAIVSRPMALRLVQRLLSELNAPADIIEVAGREKALVACPPPGAASVENRY